MGFYYRTCNQCGNPFHGRSDAKYCSPACRKKASRRKENIERVAGKVIEDIRWMRQQKTKYPDLAAFIDSQLEEMVEFLVVHKEPKKPGEM